MTQQLIPILRAYELRLLRFTLLPPSSPSPPPLQQQNLSDSTHNLLSHIDHLISLIETGDYHQSLSSPLSTLLVPNPFHGVAHSLNSAQDNEAKASTLVLLLCVAVASFFCFIHSNFTGPSVKLPEFPFLLKELEGEEIVDWERWAKNHILSHGSDLLAKFSNLQYLVFAKQLVMGTKDWLFDSEVASVYGLRSISWWFARILIIEQRILDEPSSSLFDLLQVSMAETLCQFGTLEKITGYWGTSLQDGETSDFVSMVHLEAGMMEYVYGRVDSCRLHFETAEVAAGHQLSISGALGFRTIHQTVPKAQLVLVSNKSSPGSDVSSPLTSSGAVKRDPTVVENNMGQYNEISDILMTPKLLGNGTDSETNQPSSGNGPPGYSAPLKPLQQATVLASCLLVEKSSRNDEMQRWEMAPFIEAIDSQSSSYFILKCFCNLLRIRWESTRSHTKTRALEMMDNLVEGVDKPCPEVLQRIPLFFAVYMPSISSLKKEYGELLVSCGIVGEAIKIFEDLELWDNLIYCTCLLGKKAEAVELIRKRLFEMPDDPKLWCMLGDTTNNDSYYQKALEVSKNRSARAKRSLARSAYNRGDYEESKLLWESAMALNSLYKDGWFALGAAALKARDVDKALDGFTRAVELDPDNGEAWNNIACLHMVKKKSKESFIAFKEALKYKRDSWQMWENYSHVAMDVGNIFQALEAIQMAFRLSGGKKTDAQLLEQIIREMEQKVSEESRLGVERSRETEQLLEFLGKVLHQIVSNGNGGNIWGLYARWHKIRGDLMMCSEALLKQVRSYQGLELWKDKDRFRKYAEASLELCNVYMEISSATGSRRELSSAQMHLRNIIKQAESFCEMKEYKDVEALYVEVQMKLQSLTS